MRKLVTTYRCDNREKVPKIPYGKPKPRKLSKEQVYEFVRASILKTRAEYAKNAYYSFAGRVTAEELAAELNVEIHKVILALQKLNTLGLVGQKERNFAHDTKRDPMTGFGTSGWAANVYFITLPFKRPILREPIPMRPVTWPAGTIPVWDEKEPEKLPRFSKRLGYRIRKNAG